MKTSETIVGKDGILSRNKYEPGDIISTNQYVVEMPGCLVKDYGRELLLNSFCGGTIYQDAASNIVRVNNQVSHGVGEMVMGKTAFKEWI